MPTDNTQLAAAYAQNASGGPVSTDDPIIPMWQERPKDQQPTAGNVPTWQTVKPSEAGSANAAEYAASGGTSSNAGPPEAPVILNKAMAEAQFMDMSLEDRQAFAQKAQQAGLWRPTQGGSALKDVWTKAVSDSYSYNSAHSDDPTKWLSPFEAVDKLGALNAAAQNGTFNGYAKTQEIIHQFNVNELYGQAESILQKELGRSPTDSEMKAYTAAVNAAAAKNPVQMTESGSTPDAGTIDPSTGMPLVTDTQKVYSGGGPYSAYDPTKTIEDMVRATPEHAQYQAAVDYFPAVMQALGAVVQ